MRGLCAAAALIALCGAPLAAQDTTVRQVAATFMKGQLGVFRMYQNSPFRIFVPEILPVQVSGAVIGKVSRSGALSEAEARDLATRMGASQVATPSDTIACGPQDGELRCTGTLGLQVRLGAPVVVGDSAVVVYQIARRSSTGAGLPGRANRFALILKRRDGIWKVTAYYLANQDRLQPAMGWDSVSIPGTGTRRSELR